jgi:hypothetical protein
MSEITLGADVQIINFKTVRFIFPITYSEAFLETIEKALDSIEGSITSFLDKLAKQATDKDVKTLFVLHTRWF